MNAILQASELFDRVEALRIPAAPHAAAADWKDWYHFVLWEPANGWRVLANVSLTGGGERASLQYTLVAYAPGQAAGMQGVSRGSPWHAGMVRTEPLSIRGNEVELVLRDRGWHLDLQPPRLDLALQLHARADSTPLLVTEESPFGSGHIGWGLVPRLSVDGELRACGQRVAISDDWFCYQDHNFGRFAWGGDFGWEWLVAHAAVPDGRAFTVVIDLRTDRSHQRSGLPYVFIFAGHELRKVFLGPAMTLQWTWSDRAVLPPRLPGTMATLLADRTERVPTGLSVRGADERDQLHLQLVFDAHLQVVAPDAIQPAYTRITELSGTTILSMRLDGSSILAHGTAYAEYTR
jgi:hypothetical protein